MKVLPRTIPGSLVSHNKGTLVWGNNGLIAYGANTTVAVIDTTSMQYVTTLHSHRSPVVKISWAPSLVPADDTEENVFLASADTAGFIVLFDVTAGKAKQKLTESNKVVNAVELFYANGTELLLLTLHQAAILILWNPKTGEQIWKKSFTEALSSFTRDPFNSEHIVLNGGSFVQYVTDFSFSHTPADGTRFFLSSNSSAESPSPSHTSSDRSRMSSIFFEIPRRSRLMLSDRSTRLPSVSGSSPEDEGLLSNLMTVIYHKTRRNTLILVYSQDILILDLDIKQTISIISLERSTCPFIEVYPCRYRDAMYCLHDNGTVVFRVRKLTHGSDTSTNIESKAPTFTYESHCSSDSMRITKSQKVYGLAVCPTSETRAAVITSEGKLLIWELQPPLADASSATTSLPLSLSHILHPSTCGTSMLPEGAKCSFLLVGTTNSLSQPPFVVSMCPPLTTKNLHLYQPYLAIGSVNGVVQVYDIKKGLLVRDILVHTCQVRGIAWTSLHSFITYACESLNGNVGRSELAFVNIKTGKVTNFRSPKPDEGVIQMVRISHLKQYMVIVFKGKPIELWDLKTLTLLREMSNNFPTITSLEWSPSPIKKKLPADDGTSENLIRSHHMTRESFVFTDNTCLLHHYIVEGSVVRDGSTITAQGVSGTVTAMGWRNELLALGDINSNVSFWDLRHKKSVNCPVSKGMVRKIKFAPGKDNTKILILFNDEVHVWDRVAQTPISTLKFPKNIGRVNDVDWAGSDMVVLSIADGYVAITDSKFQTYMSRFSDMPNSDESSLPCLLTLPTRLRCRYQLYPHPWDSTVQPPAELHLPEEVAAGFLSTDECDIAEKCLTAAYFYGDRFSLDFWTIASHYLKMMKMEKLRSVQNPTNDPKDQIDLFVPPSDTDKREEDHDASSKLEPLESNYDILCSSKTFKKNELSRVVLQDDKRFGTKARLDCAKKFILLGETDRAVHLLLQSEPESSTFYSDSLRACLLATVRTSGASQSTLKLVATSLIANGKISEGVELLCLIDKSLDACRYLQTYGQWQAAAWLSKVTLHSQEAAEVMTRWMNEYLLTPSVNDKTRAVLTALSIGDWMKVVEMLYGMQCFSTAAMFIEACTQYQLLEVTEQTLPIIEAVYLQYGRLLKSVDIKDGALYCWRKAGEQGKQRVREWEDAQST